METTKLVFPEHVNQSMPVKQLDKSELTDASEDRKKQIAKDFESLLLNKLFDQMKNTIGNWGFEKDGASSQVEGIFWFYLAQDIAGNGGLGLWKDIYKSMPGTEPKEQAGISLDGQL